MSEVWQKKLTEKTLRYTHLSLCPKNENRPEKKVVRQREETEVATTAEAPKPPPPPPPPPPEKRELSVMERRYQMIRDRQEQYRNLAKYAFM